MTFPVVVTWTPGATSVGPAVGPHVSFSRGGLEIRNERWSGSNGASVFDRSLVSGWTEFIKGLALTSLDGGDCSGMFEHLAQV